MENLSLLFSGSLDLLQWSQYKGIICPSLSEQHSSQKCFVLKTGKLSGCQHSNRDKTEAFKNHGAVAILKWLC